MRHFQSLRNFCFKYSLLVYVISLLRSRMEQKGTVFMQGVHYWRQTPTKNQTISINAPSQNIIKTNTAVTNRYVWTIGYTDIAKAIFTNVPNRQVTTLQRVPFRSKLLFQSRLYSVTIPSWLWTQQLSRYLHHLPQIDSISRFLYNIWSGKRWHSV